MFSVLIVDDNPSMATALVDILVLKGFHTFLAGSGAQALQILESHQIDVLLSTDVLSEGQNLQDCGVLINYDLTWNPIRLVQRNGLIDRIEGAH